MNTFPGADARVADLDLPPTLAVTPSLDRWVRFEPNGTVVIRSGKVELGQGIESAIAQIAAEELDVDYVRIQVHPMDTDHSPNEGSTSGSRSIQEGGEAMRQACAEVRGLMLAEAARQLEASTQDLEVRDGDIRVRGTDRHCTYWDLASSVSLQRLAQGQVRPKPVDQQRLMGQSLPRKDLPPKLMGTGFLQDLKLPGMLHARVVRPPAVKARLIEVDELALMRLPGMVRVVRDGHFLALVAEREEQAVAAWQKAAKWTRWQVQDALPDMHRMAEHLTQASHETEILRQDKGPANTSGEAVSATYTRPYLSHASIGPSCGLAWWHEERLEVWTHSQSLHALRDEMCKLMGLSAEQVVVRHGQGAGCYGHNGADDAAYDAALLARALPGRPIRVQWMREDEFAWEPQGPAMRVDLQARLDEQGRIADWQQSIWGNRHIQRPGRRPEAGLLAAWHQGDGREMMPPVDMALPLGGGSQRNAVPYYDMGAMTVVNHAVTDVPLRVSALRALGAHLNVFAIESFMDELAELARQDPATFRVQHLSDPRARDVIWRAVDHAKKHWGWVPGQPGDAEVGHGLAFARYKNMSCYAAVVAEVALTDQVKVTRVVAAIDCGAVVNPDGVRNQIEGGVIQACSWTLKEQVTFDRQRVTSTDWTSYPILRFSETPQVEVLLADRPTDPWLGVGEGVTGPTSAAIANALRQGLGVRVRDLPLTPERVIQSMPL